MSSNLEPANGEEIDNDSFESGDEFYDAIAAAEEEKRASLECAEIVHKNKTTENVSVKLSSTLTASQMIDSGLALSMNSSQCSDLLATSTANIETCNNSNNNTDNDNDVPPDETTAAFKQDIKKSFQTKSETSTASIDSEIPRPPPRNRKKRPGLLKATSLIESGHYSETYHGAGNNSSTDSRSMTNSIESATTTASLLHPIAHNLTSILDDISSIKGDLSITEIDDKKSVYLDENMLAKHQALRNSLLLEKLYTTDQLKDLSRLAMGNSSKLEEKNIVRSVPNMPLVAASNSSSQALATSQTPTTATSSSPEATPKIVETSNNLMILNIDTGEKTPLTNSDTVLPKCLNPLSLHLMKLTKDYEQQQQLENNNKKSNSMEKEHSSSVLGDGTTLKSVTSSLISTINETFNEIKSDIKEKSSLKRSLKKNSLPKDAKLDASIMSNTSTGSIGGVSGTTGTSDNATLGGTYELNNDADGEGDDENDEEKNNGEYNGGRLRSGIRGLKRFGTGLIRGVKGVKSAGNKERSTFHVDVHSGEPEPPPPPPRYKIKVNHKRGGADFDGLKLMQEISDGRGAIWCMKFSNCSQLLAAAGQDHLLRVYCAQKSWKYFTQLRNKASGQHISPSSTKERSSINGDSFGRKHRASYSRSGSLNANDSHNNSSSSSSSSAFAKEFYKDEDNTLSEEGPLLLFTIYRGHTGDVLDLAWSKNHFLLSSSMDKTVRLWHITRIECLCTFRHIDFVTTIQFHPRDDRYFLSGSLDGKLRLWNIPEKRVTLWNEVTAIPRGGGGSGGNSSGGGGTGDSDLVPPHGLITSSSFVQNGKFAVIGTYDGRIIFYTTDQLKYFTQILVSSKTSITSSGVQGGGASRRKSSNNKVTGIESLDDNNKILVTTNDSRLRLYDLRDLSLTCKYKGCVNQSSQIRASISHDHRYIICGSENNSFYIWRLQDNTTIGQRRDRNKQYECIRLLNPPPVPVPSNQSVFTESTSSASGGATSSGNSTITSTLPLGSNSDTVTSNKFDPKVKSLLTSGATLTSSLETTSSSIGSGVISGNSATTTNNNTTSTTTTTTNQQATKIITSALFAPVPGQLDDKAKYVIATADFNGFIRIFSKY